MESRQNKDAPLASAATRSTPIRGKQSQPLDSVTGPVKSLIRQIGIDKVYGSPITQGEITVIPVADLRTGFGFGGGRDVQAGDGAGGGAGLRLTPRGYLEITPEEVRYRPIYDVSTVVLGGAFLGWLLYRFLSR